MAILTIFVAKPGTGDVFPFSFLFSVLEIELTTMHLQRRYLFRWAKSLALLFKDSTPESDKVLRECFILCSAGFAGSSVLSFYDLCLDAPPISCNHGGTFPERTVHTSFPSLEQNTWLLQLKGEGSLHCQLTPKQRHPDRRGWWGRAAHFRAPRNQDMKKGTVGGIHPAKTHPCDLLSPTGPGFSLHMQAKITME